jgi:hypothetical protein
MCGVFLTLALVCMAAACTLLVHHYYKHAHDLEGTDRCFQPEDVCVLCGTSRPLLRRCSHQQVIVLLVLAAGLLVWQFFSACV